MTYRLTADARHVVRIADGVVIPLPPQEREGLKYQRWLDEGNQPLPYEPPPPQPVTEVTMRQARLALLQAGKLAAVEAAIDNLDEPDRTVARTEWEYSGTVQRYQPLVQALAPALGLTEAQMDDLFKQAAKL